MKSLLNNRFSIFILALILITVLTIAAVWPKLKIQGYNIIRNLSKYQLALVTRDFKTLDDTDFIIKYVSENEDSARLVLENSKEIKEQVNAIIGFENKGRVPIIVYPSMTELNKSFGWDGDRSPMGVYWMGSIRILAPDVWVDEDADKRLVFKNMGPMAHEYSHFVVDYKTNGNYTRWFTEGIAQYVERKITGFTLEEPEREAKDNLYSFKDLNGTFDDQKDQDLAYWQSLIAIDYLVENLGEEKVFNEMLDRLGQGQKFEKVFQETVGLDLDTFEENLRQYAKTK